MGEKFVSMSFSSFVLFDICQFVNYCIGYLLTAWPTHWTEEMIDHLVNARYQPQSYS